MSNSPLTKCEHPVRILNKSTGEYMFVPCGHCQHCRHTYTLKWQERLQLESKASKSVLFFTLTYDNLNVPTVCYDLDRSFCATSNRVPSFYVPNCSENLLNFIPYVKSDNINQFTDVAIVSKYDIQLFLKRLRRNIEYDKEALLSEVSQSDREIRYFICSEYGPQTFRPHYHGLFFFKNKCVADAVKSCYIFKSWKLCNRLNLDCSEVFADASGYVSKYVTCNTSLPSLLQIKEFRTFHLFSRRPAIGCTDFIKGDMRKLVEKRCITYTKVSTSPQLGIRSIQMPYPSQLLRYWMPKSFEPSSLSRDLLYQVLTYSSEYCLRKGLRHWDFRCISLCLGNRIKQVKSDYNLFNHDYVQNNFESYRTYSDVSSSLSFEERWFGIPQNRMLIVRALTYIHILNIDILDYVKLYFSFYTLLFSESYKFQVEYENNLHVDKLRKFELLFPSFFLNLPQYYGNIDLFEEAVFSDYLSNFDLCLADFFTDTGEILDKYRYDNLRTIHTDSTEYILLHNVIVDSDIEFDKIRKNNYFNYFNN